MLAAQQPFRYCGKITASIFARSVELLRPRLQAESTIIEAFLHLFTIARSSGQQHSPLNSSCSRRQVVSSMGVMYWADLRESGRRLFSIDQTMCG